MNEQKERLERELRFLRESLDAGVITNEECSKGEARIKRKLDELPEEIEIKEVKEIVGEQEEKPPKIEIFIDEPKEEPPEEVESVYINKKALLIIGIIIVLVIGYFLFKPSAPTEETETNFTIPGPLCSSDEDCNREGKIGICQNPGKEEANCLFQEPETVKLTVINDKGCRSCDSSRMIGVLKQIFPGLVAETADVANAGEMISGLGIESLPAYVFESAVDQTTGYAQFARALSKKGDNYVILPTASGANYFFKRKRIENKLEVFVLADDSDQIDSNVKDVLELFNGKISYSKTVVADQEALKKELAITSFPTFLINNQLKFSGVQPAEVIKAKFCELNELPECSIALSRNVK